MRVDASTAAWLRLGLVRELHPAPFRALLKAFGLPQEVLRAARSQLARVVPDAVAQAVASGAHSDEVDRALAWLEAPGHTLVTLADDEYPRALLEINDPPPILYVRGNAALLRRASIAIVGSRNATPQGRSNAESFARTLSLAGLTVVSGLAAGIDAAAHRGALAGPGSTIAVLGTGADIVYPRSNEALAQEIAVQGALISEFALGTPPLAAHFPRRNRVISALARGCLVVEAAVQSGSLITARLAAEQGRDVFAIPGSIHSPVSRGCHALIRQGAKLVESAQDVLEELRLAAPDTKTPEILDSDAGLVQYMGHEPCDVGSLVHRSGLPAAVVSAMLLQLELEGRVGSLPGGLYQRTG
jgi:DNA processing protein